MYPHSFTYDRAMYHLYILECAGGSLYTGITTDIKRRFKEHSSGNGGHYTRSQKVVRVAYTEPHPEPPPAPPTRTARKNPTPRPNKKFYF